jgi:hypothetical protein
MDIKRGLFTLNLREDLTFDVDFNGTKWQQSLDIYYSKQDFAKMFRNLDDINKEFLFTVAREIMIEEIISIVKVGHDEVIKLEFEGLSLSISTRDYRYEGSHELLKVKDLVYQYGTSIIYNSMSISSSEVVRLGIMLEDIFTKKIRGDKNIDITTVYSEYPQRFSIKYKELTIEATTDRTIVNNHNFTIPLRNLFKDFFARTIDSETLIDEVVKLYDSSTLSRRFIEIDTPNGNIQACIKYKNVVIIVNNNLSYSSIPMDPQMDFTRIADYAGAVLFEEEYKDVDDFLIELFNFIDSK